MTTDEYINQLDTAIAGIDAGQITLDAASAVHTKMIARIFDQGQSAAGQIGAYNTKPIYASQKQFENNAGFKAVGKTGKTQFDTGKPHKSMYLQQGYKQLKEVQGLESNFVNLTYAGDLRNELESLQLANGVCTAGISGPNAQKLNALKAKYGEELFDLTNEEQEAFKEEVTRVLLAQLSII